jgi:hypothetical protein
MTPPSGATDAPGASRSASPTRTVYVRPGVLVLHRAVTSRRMGDDGAARMPRDPEADRALQTLSELGLRVTITDGAGEPADIGVRDWLLTDAVDDCRWARHAGVRTVLIGGPSSAGSLPERCDRSVSSLYGAALEIVVEESSGAPTRASSGS